MAEIFLPERAAPFEQLVDTGNLEPLVKKARHLASKAKADNTNLAYAGDWKHYLAWCKARFVAPFPPNPQTIGLYLTAMATEPRAGGGEALSVETIERRLTGLAWNFRQRQMHLDRTDPHIATVLDGIRNQYARPPVRKVAVLAPDVVAMLGVLPTDLGGIRDRAILLLGFAGGLRRSEIVGLDFGRNQSEDGRGWVEFLDGGIVLHIRGKTGWREVAIGAGSSERTCPIAALKEWLRVGKIDDGAIFRKLAPSRRKVTARRLAGQHVARLVKTTALAAGVRGDLSESVRRLAFAGHSLRAGLATGAEVDERYVQAQLGHATPNMTRRYQRDRDRFKVNLTKAAGL
jgi:integrase